MMIIVRYIHDVFIFSTQYGDLETIDFTAHDTYIEVSSKVCNLLAAGVEECLCALFEV